MNEELVDRRLSDVEKKLVGIDGKIDKLAELMGQTQLQEYRITELEQSMRLVKNKVEYLEGRAGNAALKWLGIIGGGIASILLGYIAVKVGLK